MEYREVVVVDIRREECMRDISTEFFDLLHNTRWRVQEVQGNELNPGISEASVEWPA